MDNDISLVGWALFLDHDDDEDVDGCNNEDDDCNNDKEDGGVFGRVEGAPPADCALQPELGYHTLAQLHTHSHTITSHTITITLTHSPTDTTL